MKPTWLNAAALFLLGVLCGYLGGHLMHLCEYWSVGLGLLFLCCNFYFCCHAGILISALLHIK